MKHRWIALTLGAALVAALALSLVVAVAQDDDVPDDFNQATIDAAIEEFFQATAEAEATFEAEMADAPPMTATIQAAFEDAQTATAEAALAAALYGSVTLVEPEALDYPTHHTEEGDPAIGPTDATITITEYSDFACSYCRRFYNETLPTLLDEYEGQVRFVYRDFPILGDSSGLAAIAAECADEQDRFWEYHNYLFANSGSFDQTKLMAIAFQLELDMDAFEACMAADTVHGEIEDDFNVAVELGATGTPSFTINAEFIVGAQPIEEFQRVIEEQLEYAVNPPPPTEEPIGPAAEIVSIEEMPQWDASPEMAIDTDKNYRATLVTSRGDIVVELFADQAPITVNNFVFLAREGYYDLTTFHRVIDGFMAQAGDPSGTGRGGPGYTFEDETDNGLTFDEAGLLAMANAGADTNGSQFFITFAPTTWLDGAHTIFGRVIEGTDVLDALTRRDPTESPSYLGDTLITVEIEEMDAE
jgi:cyclophilin family peptidyl-prolyl cis-trans isomerase/protein-disulfide isomerase